MLGYRLRHEKVVLQRRQGGTSGVRPEDEDDTGGNGNGNQNTETTTSTVVRTRSSATTTSSATSSVIVQQTTTSTTEQVQATSSSTTTTSSIVETTTSTTSTSTVVSTTSTTSATNLLPTTATARVTSSGTRTIPLATIATPSTSATAGAANSGSSAPVGTIIGIIAAGLVGVVVIAAGLGWLFRRYFSKKDNYRSDFMRNSVAIPDDYNEKPPMGSKNALNLARQNAYMDGPSTNPRPPTMIERRLNATGNAGFQPGEVIPQQDNNGYYADPNAGYYDQGQYGYNQQYGQYPDPQHMGYPPQVGGAAYYNDYNQYGSEGHYPAAQDPYYGQGQDGQYAHNAYQQQQYSDIQQQLDHGMAPAGAAPGAPQERSLTNNAPAASGAPNAGANYASLTAAAGLDSTERSGTPVDRNPQQAYLPSAGDSRRLAAGQTQAGTQMPVKRESFNGDDAYGGM